MADAPLIENVVGPSPTKVARVLLYQTYRTAMDRGALLRLASSGPVAPPVLDPELAVEYCYEVGAGVLRPSAAPDASGVLPQPVARIHLCLPPQFGVLVEQGLLRPGTEAIVHYEKVIKQASLKDLVGPPMLLVTHVKLVGLRHGVERLSLVERDRALAALETWAEPAQMPQGRPIQPVMADKDHFMPLSAESAMVSCCLLLLLLRLSRLSHQKFNAALRLFFTRLLPFLFSVFSPLFSPPSTLGAVLRASVRRQRWGRAAASA